MSGGGSSGGGIDLGTLFSSLGSISGSGTTGVAAPQSVSIAPQNNPITQPDVLAPLAQGQQQQQSNNQSWLPDLISSAQAAESPPPPPQTPAATQQGPGWIQPPTQSTQTGPQESTAQMPPQPPQQQPAAPSGQLQRGQTATGTAPVASTGIFSNPDPSLPDAGPLGNVVRNLFTGGGATATTAEGATPAAPAGTPAAAPDPYTSTPSGTVPGIPTTPVKTTSVAPDQPSAAGTAPQGGGQPVGPAEAQAAGVPTGSTRVGQSQDGQPVYRDPNGVYHLPQQQQGGLQGGPQGGPQGGQRGGGGPQNMMQGLLPLILQMMMGGGGGQRWHGAQRGPWAGRWGRGGRGWHGGRGRHGFGGGFGGGMGEMMEGLLPMLIQAMGGTGLQQAAGQVPGGYGYGGDQGAGYSPSSDAPVSPQSTPASGEKGQGRAIAEQNLSPPSNVAVDAPPPPRQGARSDRAAGEAPEAPKAARGGGTTAIRSEGAPEEAAPAIRDTPGGTNADPFGWVFSPPTPTAPAPGASGGGSKPKSAPEGPAPAMGGTAGGANADPFGSLLGPPTPTVPPPSGAGGGGATGKWSSYVNENARGGMTPAQRRMLESNINTGGLTPDDAGKVEPPQANVNFMHGQYGAPGRNITPVNVNGLRFEANRASAPHFAGFIKDLQAAGAPISEVSGYANRTIGGTNTISQHAFGNAIDINQTSRNAVTGGFDRWAAKNPQALRSAMNRWGMISGGDWQHKDFGHFEWNGGGRGDGFSYNPSGAPTAGARAFRGENTAPATGAFQ